jgi:mRNA interferase RelE/StbE
MIYRLFISKIAEKNLAQLSLKDRRRIDLGFGKIMESPFAGKKLNGKLQGAYSIRVWPFRILYKIQQKKLVILVLKVVHRKEAYK